VEMLHYKTELLSEGVSPQARVSVRPLTAGAANVAHDRATGVNGHIS
jgi:hypothetical protein